MKAKVELGRSREFGDIVSDAFALVRQNFKPLLKAYFTIGGLFIVAGIFVSLSAVTNRGDDGAFTGMWFLEMLFGFLNYTVLILITCCYFTLYKEKGSQPPTVIEVWGYFRYYFFRVFFTHLILAIAIIIGYFLCVAPGVYLSVVFSLITPIMVVENGGIEYSVRRAFKLINQYWWFTFGIILIETIFVLLTLLVLMIPPIIIYGAGEFLAGKSLNTVNGTLYAVIINIGHVLWLLPSIAILLVYFSLTEDKEGNSLLNRIKMFGKNTPDMDQLSSEQY